MTGHPELDERLAELVSDYVDALNGGTAPSVERLLDEHRDVGDRLGPLLRTAEAHAGGARETRKSAPPESFAMLRSRLLTERPPVDQVADAPREFPIQFGNYVLLGEIARGGMGVVFRARQPGLDRDVALKMSLAGSLATSDEVARFVHEARTAATLVHPNIVRIYDSGEHEGRAFFTMELIEGKSLASHLPALRRDHQRAAKLVATVARAVSYAHQRGILHRDLKPANILLDAEGTPLVTDFGLAKRIGGERGLTESGTIMGNPGYLAPEQIAGRSGLTEPGTIMGTVGYMSPEQAAARVDLTTRADVYSLGAILYELLTGRPPIVADSYREMLRRLQEEEPVRPRKRNPSVHHDLEAICLKCLEKDPDRRYTSTALAEDLEHVVRGEPPEGIRSRWAGLRRHPVASAIAAQVVLFMTVAFAAGLSVTSAQARDRRQEVLRTNVYAARTLAGAVLAQLKDYREAMTQAARELPPGLAGSLLQPFPAGGEALERYCHDAYSRSDDPGQGLRDPGGPPPFNTWFILSTDGVARARWPAPPKEFLGKNYAWRDYFLGAKALGLEGQRAAHVSRAFLSEADDTLKFAISAPLYGPDGAWVGVIVAMADSGATLGPLKLSDLNDEHRTAALTAPWDHTRELAQANAPFPSAYAVLVHDSLDLGQLTKLESAKVHDVVARADQGRPRQRLEQLRPADPDAVAFDEEYRDPVEGYGGQWLAGFAPVGNTGLVVIVQTPHDTVSRPNQTLGRRLAFWGGVYLVLGTALLAALLIARRWAARGF